MPDSEYIAEAPAIGQLLLKPLDSVVLDDTGQLPPDYLQALQDSLSLPVQLGYRQAMSGGVHVLGLEPEQSHAQALEIAAQLTERDDVEYAEPDFPRRLR
ncbi:MAG: hypothetical protein R3E89_01350 [Thiolinea sp.]